MKGLLMRFAAVFLVLFAASCGDPTPPNSEQEDDETTLPIQPEAVDRVALNTFTGSSACAQLEESVEALALQQLRVAMVQNKKSAIESWKWRRANPNGYGFADAGYSPSVGGNGTSAGPANYTTTNTQHVDIDEPDIIKNDGTRLFSISGRRLFATTTWPAAQLHTRGSLEISGQPFEMLLEGNRVIVFSRVFERSFGVPRYCHNAACSWYSNATAVTWVDVSNLDELRVIQRRYVPGEYRTARRVDDVVRLVTTTQLNLNDLFETYPYASELDSATSPRAIARQFDALLATNEGKLRARTLEQWLPGVTFDEATCGDVWLTNASSRLGATHVTSLRVSDPSSLQRQTLLAAVDLVYQGESLFLAQRHWWWSTDQRELTHLYRFDLSQNERVNFIAAGSVAGIPINQFALDEHRGNLRVAITEGTHNRVVVLGTNGTSLTQLGTTPDLAPGERIMSARFFGDRGYIVTFRQVDPLYSLDLSDAANPRVTGELKIPGFSSYLHPLDDDHLLTIGTAFPENGGWPRTVQLQIFDVSNPAQPIQAHSQIVGQDWGSSEAQWEHRAFNYFPAKKLLAIPHFESRWDNTTYSYTSDLRVFHVDAQQGFTAKGSIDVGDMLTNSSCGASYCWSWWWEPGVRRSVMADDFVYAVTSGGVRVANIDSLTMPIATAVFPAAP